mmetsp:Transcript_4540/g.12821  ORF Transcript_4540/g.12821 Transcript_4540/m.12821 type:complete len:276 (-) Transcript_4540:5336-6163(-)
MELEGNCTHQQIVHEREAILTGSDLDAVVQRAVDVFQSTKASVCNLILFRPGIGSSENLRRRHLLLGVLDDGLVGTIVEFRIFRRLDGAKLHGERFVRRQLVDIAHCSNKSAAIQQHKWESSSSLRDAELQKKKFLRGSKSASRRDEATLPDVLHHLLLYAPGTLHFTSKTNGDGRQLQATGVSIGVHVIAEELELVEDLSFFRAKLLAHTGINHLEHLPIRSGNEVHDHEVHGRCQRRCNEEGLGIVHGIQIAANLSNVVDPLLVPAIKNDLDG